MEPMNRKAATPSNIVTSDDLLKRMRLGVKETYEITCRGLTVPVRIITLDEQTAIRREAIREVAKIGGDKTDQSVYIQKSVLRLASTPKEKSGMPFLNDNFLKDLSVDETNFLYSEYMKVFDDVNPSLEQMGQDEFRALVEAVKKNNVSWSDLSLRHLRAIFTSYQDLIQRMASQTSPQDSTSGGQQ